VPYANRRFSNLGRASGQYCDTLRSSWLQQDTLTDDQKCSDCVLGGIETDLNSPFGYDQDYEADFRSSTSSCKKSTYTINTPGSYTLAPTTTTTTTTVATPSCRATHVVSATDSCLSVALQHSVSTWSLISLNGLDPRCNYLPTNTSLCIGEECLTYQVNPNDNCDSVIASAKGGLTASQFAAWNPNIDALCLNLHNADINVVCVG
jgi:hypothetical protein